MKKRKTLFLLIASTVSLGAVGLAATNFAAFGAFSRATSVEFGFTLDARNATTVSGEVTATDTGNPVELAFAGASAEAGAFVALEAGGSIANTREILGLTKITVNFSGEAVIVKAGAARGAWTTETTLTESGTVVLSASANYFEIAAGETPVTITSVRGIYDCVLAPAAHTLGGYTAKVEGDYVNVYQVCATCGETYGTPVLSEEALSAATYKINESGKTETSYFSKQDGVWKSNIKGKKSATVYLDIEIEEDGALMFHVDCEGEGAYDYAVVSWNYSEVWTNKSNGTSSNKGSYDFNELVSAGDIITITYTKDSSGDVGADEAVVTIGEGEVPYGAVTIDARNGDELGFALATAGVCPDIPAPEREGYYFDGWFLDEECTIAFNRVQVDGDQTIYAKWLEPVTMTYVYGDREDTVDTYRPGSTVVLPEKPTREGYLFINWYTDESLTTVYNPSAINANTTVYAKWLSTEEVNPLYGSYGGFTLKVSTSLSTYASYRNIIISEAGHVKARTGWSTYIEGDIESIDTETGVVTLAQGGTIGAMKYIASADAILVSPNESFFTAETFVAFRNIADDPTTSNNITSNSTTIKVGDDTIALISTPIKGKVGNQNLYINTAKDEAVLGVSFVDSYTKEAFTPTDPKMKNTLAFEVTGTDGTILHTFGKATTSTYDKIFAADASLDVYRGVYTVGEQTLKINGAGVLTYSAVSSSSLFSYEEIAENVIYAKCGAAYHYDFVLDRQAMTATATIPMVTVTLDFGYEEAGEPVTATEEWEKEKYTSISAENANPTRPGYLFKGWYTEPNGQGTKISGTKALTEDTTFYAYWVDAVTVTVHVGDGHEDIVIPAEAGTSPVINVKNGTKAFLGFYTDEECTELWSSVVGEGGEELYCKWDSIEWAGHYDGVEVAYSSYTEKTYTNHYAFDVAEDGLTTSSAPNYKDKDFSTLSSSRPGCYSFKAGSHFFGMQAADGRNFILTAYRAFSANYHIYSDSILLGKLAEGETISSTYTYLASGKWIVETTITPTGGEPEIYKFYIAYDGKNASAGSSSMAYVDVVFEKDGEPVNLHEASNGSVVIKDAAGNVLYTK